MCGEIRPYPGIDTRATIWLWWLGTDQLSWHGIIVNLVKMVARLKPAPTDTALKEWEKAGFSRKVEINRRFTACCKHF